MSSASVCVLHFSSFCIHLLFFMVWCTRAWCSHTCHVFGMAVVCHDGGPTPCCSVNVAQAECCLLPLERETMRGCMLHAARAHTRTHTQRPYTLVRCFGSTLQHRCCTIRVCASGFWLPHGGVVCLARTMRPQRGGIETRAEI